MPKLQSLSAKLGFTALSSLSNLMLTRILEEVDNLLQLQLSLVGTSHVGEGDTSLRHLLELGLVAAELHGTTKAARPGTALRPSGKIGLRTLKPRQLGVHNIGRNR